MGSMVTVAFPRAPDAGCYAIFRPRVRGTVMGSCCEQKEPLLEMDRIVSQPLSRHTRPALNDRDGRSLPEIGRPPTAGSDMPRATARARSGIPTSGPATRASELGFGALEAERSGHPR